MAKQSPSLYSVSKTFIWFAVVSLVLFASLVAVVWLDHEREWKVWQKKFIDLKVKKIQGQIQSAGAAQDKNQISQAQKKLNDATTAFGAKKAEHDKATQEAEHLSSSIAKVKANYQGLKQYQDSYRYYLEEYRLHHDPKASAMEKKLSEIIPKVSTLKEELDSLEHDKEAKDRQAAVFLESIKTDQKDLDKLLDEQTRYEKQLKKIKPTIVKDILNAPMVDFIAPSLQVQQIVLENIQDDYHFAKVPKVDRCTTCHMGIDQKGFEDAPQPFRTHPKLDLYLGTASPHSIDKFGCTTCHGGSGQALSFIETAHTPRDAAQQKEWEKKYHWKEMHHWENKMLPLQHTESSCVKCHQNVAEVPQANKLNRGRALASTLGCVNCHKINGYESTWKVGPDLQHVRGKLNEEWIAKWVQNPQDFRPSTKMPRVFHLSNTASGEDREKNEAAIHAITTYLIQNSQEGEALSAPTVTGDGAHGEKLIKNLGCLGCHSLPGVTAGTAGPELSGLGSKVKPEWLYTWLKNPKHLSPGTRMPNLRLTDQEASDITAYLMAQKNESFDRKAAPRANMEVVDKMILEQLQGTLRHSEAQAELKKMSGEEKLLFLGKKSIGHQGCFACHAIKGFETTPPIGADLSDEGRKDITKFDFGFVDIDKTRHAWIEQKLKDPRIFDQGKLKSYYEKLRMPQFNLTDEERESLLTFVLSLTEEKMPLEIQRRLDSKDREIQEGMRLVKKLNCQACHSLSGTEGVLRKITTDPGQAPPILDGEGAKVQEEWLHEFLKSPAPIRPWINYRMPTFDLSEEELQALVAYFHHAAGQKTSYGPQGLPESTEELLGAGKGLFESFQCVKCHKVTQDSAAMGASFLAPDLTLTKKRLKSQWVHDWLKDPAVLQEGTMMPTFFADGQSPMPDVLGGDADKQITAIRDYLYRYEESEADPKSKKA